LFTEDYSQCVDSKPHQKEGVS